jgi:hypothetical protein
MRNERLHEYVPARFTPEQCFFLESLADTLDVPVAESIRMLVNEAMRGADTAEFLANLPRDKNGNQVACWPAGTVKLPLARGMP